MGFTDKIPEGVKDSGSSSEEPKLDPIPSTAEALQTGQTEYLKSCAKLPPNFQKAFSTLSKNSRDFCKTESLTPQAISKKVTNQTTSLKTYYTNVTTLLTASLKRKLNTKPMKDLIDTKTASESTGAIDLGTVTTAFAYTRVEDKPPLQARRVLVDAECVLFPPGDVQVKLIEHTLKTETEVAAEAKAAKKARIERVKAEVKAKAEADEKARIEAEAEANKRRKLDEKSQKENNAFYLSQALEERDNIWESFREYMDNDWPMESDRFTTIYNDSREDYSNNANYGLANAPTVGLPPEYTAALDNGTLDDDMHDFCARLEVNWRTGE